MNESRCKTAKSGYNRELLGFALGMAVDVGK